MEPQSPWLLVILFILGLCTVAGGEKPSACQCSRLSPKSRKNCGYPGISSEECFASGCCFDTQVPGVPWCFTPLPKEASEECVMEVKERVNCGYPGISSETCKARSCCFDDQIPEVPWCFYPLSVEENEPTPDKAEEPMGVQENVELQQDISESFKKESNIVKAEFVTAQQ
ncbi:trefoil factor 2 [Trichosurus vulpecula]|uniref:trefoil factor 2 n=1 Tax=Trichosurus vulpecula TaxID=9337 RepID=UPI00186AD897|nr:trefoil factor 2 [Trichosurus vulpecula]